MESQHIILCLPALPSIQVFLHMRSPFVLHVAFKLRWKHHCYRVSLAVQICRTYALDGYCPYGSRCRFVHAASSDGSLPLSPPLPGSAVGARSRRRRRRPCAAAKSSKAACSSSTSDGSVVTDWEQVLTRGISCMCLSQERARCLLGKHIYMLWDNPRMHAPNYASRQSATMFCCHWQTWQMSPAACSSRTF